MTEGITIVKIGGSTLGRHDTTLEDVAFLHREGRRLVVVHGGGDLVSRWLKAHGVQARFLDGLRVTEAESLEVVVSVLAGLVNKRLVAQLNALGARAVGLSGADGALLRARRARPELGFVGEITAVDRALLETLLKDGCLPVVASIAVEEEGGGVTGQLLNVNADTVAGEMARHLGAAALAFLTDVAGVLDGQGHVLARLSPAEAERLLAAGTVTGGMIPKVEAALVAAAGGTSAVILDGRRSHALRDALEGGGGGTVIAGPIAAP
jgi:acetylglutamate kinase